MVVWLLRESGVGALLPIELVIVYSIVLFKIINKNIALLSFPVPKETLLYISSL